MIFRRSEVLFVVLFFVVLIAGGAVGYRWIEGWTWDDALYMTVITITAVGYHEVHALSNTGRYWTTFMLAGGITGLGMWFALVTASIVRMDLGNNYTRRKTMKRLKRIRDHIIVCGGGRMGLQVVHELENAGQDFVVIDRGEEAAEALRRISPDVLIVPDDATRDRVLRTAGVERAKGLVTCLSADADNLYVCLSAHHLNPELVIVARAEGKAATAKMYRAGANHVVSPNVTGAVWVASVLVRPSVASILDVTAPGRHLSRRVDHATIGPDSALIGKSLGEAGIQDETGLLVIAIRKQDSTADDVRFNPDAATELGAGDDVIVLGDDEQIRHLRSFVT